MFTIFKILQGLVRVSLVNLVILKTKQVRNKPVIAKINLPALLP